MPVLKNLVLRNSYLYVPLSVETSSLALLSVKSTTLLTGF
jgi:hypothetical protein